MSNEKLLREVCESLIHSKTRKLSTVSNYENYIETREMFRVMSGPEVVLDLLDIAKTAADARYASYSTGRDCQPLNKALDRWNK